MAEKKKQKNLRKSHKTIKRILCVLLCTFCAVLLASVMYSVMELFVPYVSMSLYQSTGITIEEGLTLSEFSLQDIVVFIMMWFLPSLASTIVIALASWQIIKAVIKALGNILIKAFSTKLSEESPSS